MATTLYREGVHCLLDDTMPPAPTDIRFFGEKPEEFDECDQWNGPGYYYCYLDADGRPTTEWFGSYLTIALAYCSALGNEQEGGFMGDVYAS